MPQLDRLKPLNFEHVQKFPGTRLREITEIPPVVEVTKIPLASNYHRFYDQGREGACVGFGESTLMSILNRKKYEAPWLYHEAQTIDGFPTPHEGTTLSAGFDILRNKGHRRFYRGSGRPEEMDEGIVEVNRWLTSVEQVRSAIFNKLPVVLGINWYDAFYGTVQKNTGTWWVRREHWLPLEPNWGSIAGGHCICAPLWSDKREAVGWLNSWGDTYPWPVWVPAKSLERLLREDGEAAIVTDR